MKKMKFIREAGTKKLVAVVKEVGAIHGDGCCIHIENEKDNILEKAVKLGLTDGYMKVGLKNVAEFYKFGEITLLNIKGGNTTVFDSYINDDTWIAEKYKDNGFIYHYSKGEEEQKHTVRIYLKNVTWIGIDNEIKHGKHYVAFNKVLWDVSLGKAGEPSDLYIYDKNESHHEKAAWDNRIKSTMNLTAEEHRKHHNIISAASHQVVVNIDTLEELEAFLEYLRNN